MKGWYGNRYEHSLASRGIKTETNRLINLYKDKYGLKMSDIDLKRLRNIAKEIVDDIPDYVYHRISFGDFWGMMSNPENTPRRLSTSSVYLSVKELEKNCIRSGRDLSLKLEHFGCPVPYVYYNPFEGEENSTIKEYITRMYVAEELKNRFGNLCPDEIETYDVAIFNSERYANEHEIQYILTEENKRDIANKIVEIIIPPNYKLYGSKENVGHSGIPELKEKCRLEVPEDNYAIERFYEGVE